MRADCLFGVRIIVVDDLSSHTTVSWYRSGLNYQMAALSVALSTMPISRRVFGISHSHSHN